MTIQQELNNLKSFEELEKWADSSPFFLGRKGYRLSFTEFQDVVWVNFIVLNPKNRRKGYGTAIFKRIIEIAKECEKKSVNLLVSPMFGLSKDELKIFYRGLGFQSYVEDRYPKDEDYMRFAL